MHNHFISRITLLATVLTGLGFMPCHAAQPVARDNNAAPGQSLFQLSAKVNQVPELSRAELDPKSMQVGQDQPAKEISLAAAVPIVPAQTAATQRATVPQAEPPSDPGQIKEYNVNWSAWISRLADRWYFTLTQYENGFGIRFVSVRPALIEFTCHDDGSISNINLKQSSGAPVYDRLQMIALSQVAPLPPFPQGTKRKQVTLVQGWESHERRPGESDFKPGSFGKSFPMEKVSQWVKAR